MEDVLNKINQKYISLPEDEKKRNTKILDQILESIISKLREKDELFNHMYERIFCGGSYYDKIKVGKPEEYDMDLVLNLPLLAEPDVEISDQHGFVHVLINEFVKLLKSPEGKKFAKLDSLMDGAYLSTEKVLRWTEKIMTLAFKDTKKDGNGYYFEVDIGQEDPIKIYAIIAKAHPAFTLKLKNLDNSITFDVDLVPCFQFTEKKWPKGDYRPIPKSSKSKKFLVVPKKPDISSNCENIDKYWRLSFQEQERDLITGNEYNKMKPSIKLLKLLRDKHNHKISSYFIKTVFLWELEQRQDKSFWSEPLNHVFMGMLQKYAERLENRCIPYYWNKNFNLIGNLKDSTLTGISNCLKKIVTDVNRNRDDVFRISKYLITPDQVEILKSEVPLGKKYLKQISILDTSATSAENNVVDYLEESSKPNGMSANSSASTTTDSNSSNTTFDLRKSLALSAGGLADVIEQLFKQNSDLQESNRAILKICSGLSERVTDLERKCEELSTENMLMRRRVQTTNFPAGGEFDGIGLLLLQTSTDRNNFNI